MNVDNSWAQELEDELPGSKIALNSPAILVVGQFEF